MSRNLVDSAKTHFMLSFEMLEKMICHCDGILREYGYSTVKWLDYFGE